MYWDKLDNISEIIMDVIFILETVKDACFGSDKYAYVHTLDIAIKKQEEVYEELNSF